MQSRLEAELHPRPDAPKVRRKEIHSRLQQRLEGLSMVRRSQRHFCQGLVQQRALGVLVGVLVQHSAHLLDHELLAIFGPFEFRRRWLDVLAALGDLCLRLRHRAQVAQHLKRFCFTTHNTNAAIQQENAEGPPSCCCGACTGSHWSH